jgi:hypothetical protein
MSVASSRYTTTTNRLKKSSTAKSSLLHDNVKNYPHRETLVKRSSPTKRVNPNSTASAISGSYDSINLQKIGGKNVYSVNNASSELISELSVAPDQSVYTAMKPQQQPQASLLVKALSKRGSLLGPFKFMTEELSDNQLNHYNKGHLETVLKQLELLQFLVTSKFQEERKENEEVVIKAWNVVTEKEDEAFHVGIKERTVEEVQNCHYRLVEMVRNESLFF